MKSIEMQVALPRTVDAGKVQENMNKHGQQLQDSLTVAQLKQEEIKRRKISGNEETSKLNNGGRRHSHEGSEMNPESGNRDASKDTASTAHPFLGTKLDFSG